LTSRNAARYQTATSLPFQITNIQDLEKCEHIQRVIDAGNDHFIGISNEVFDIDYDGNRYSLMAGLYGPSGRQIQRFANVYYTAAARSKAETVAVTLSVLRGRQLETLRQPVRLAWDTDTACIWVTDEKSRVPNVVGETRTTNVTYFDVTSQTDQNEFSRVIAHEWGHLAIPAARGFSSPEPDSAGHVGEALGLTWLQRSTVRGAIPLALPTESYVTSLQSRYEKALFAAPPGSTGFTKRNANGMFAYIGAILHVAARYGDAFLGRVFQAVDADSTDAFLTAWTFVLSEDGQIRSRGTAWVPLEAGVYIASNRVLPIHFKGPASVSCDVALRVVIRRSGWYLVTSPTRDSLILRRKGR
jgi:hypothetical protein